MQAIEGATRDAVIRPRLRYGHAVVTTQWLLLACQRPFPAAAGVRLVSGPGASLPETQRFEFRVRERFAADFSCERENAQSPCLPLRPITLRFNAPVPRAAALAARRLPAGGTAIALRTPDGPGQGTLDEVQFAAPLAETPRFSLVLPADLRDDAGRALSNAAAYPLNVATGSLPPSAKFAGAPFGILE